MRLIDADALKQDLSRFYDGEVTARNLIDEQPTIIVLDTSPKWILCSERLPEPSINSNTLDFENVLCSTAFGDVRTYGYGKPTGHDVAHFWHGCGIMDAYVKAWMPLPPVYKENQP